MRITILSAWLLVFIMYYVPLWAQLSVAPLFTHHAVLQRDKPLPVWGWSRPGSKVSVQLSGILVSAKTDKHGKWMAALPALPAGGPHELIVQSGVEKLKFSDIWLGEVWLCSGQSNMEWKLSQAHNYAIEKSNANQPTIRQFFVPMK